MAINRDRKNIVEEKDEFESTLINVNRVTKAVKGGRKMRFSALVVVGNHNGQVGIGIGKAAEVPEAIKKATAAAKKSLITVTTVGTTIPHEILGRFGSGKVILLPAGEGTGVIAGGPVRLILELSGIKDIRTKSIGTNNPINSARATIDGLKKLRNVETIARLRGKSVEEILG